jgi:hypothetical protein
MSVVAVAVLAANSGEQQRLPVKMSERKRSSLVICYWLIVKMIERREKAMRRAQRAGYWLSVIDE